MYDMLYSKASAAHSLAGFVVRSISLMSSSAAFVAFCIVVDNHNFSHKNIIVTYLLLVGAVFLEIYAIVMLIFSERTLLRLKKKKKGYGNFLYRVISACPSASMNRKRWSGYMAQYNLIGFCVNDKPSQYEEIQRFFGIYESLEIARYKTWEKVTNELKQMIFAHIKRRTATASSPEAFKNLCSNRGDYTLRKKSCVTQFSWSVLAVEFDHSILLWHIATDLCYYSDLNRSKNIGNANLSPSSRAITSKFLSDYMLYLLVLRPSMLPKGIGEIKYRDTCAEAQRFISQRRNAISSREQACMSLLEVETIILPEIAKGNESMSVLFDGCRLAKSLQEWGGDVDRWKNEEKWDMMEEMWIEMLCYAATQCKWKPHIQQLSRGGELLTHVGLLMAHLGLSEQFQVSTGISKGISLPPIY
ncbi:hypothetical protein Vadar_023109 [Vaccinium darrowii]|uniref:Uncharacterized protein n=1 Tax=Vaccinium darrowii TaxID=229202 RepID=A0ACB7Z5G3_9ERIC|nr:hypothetical protein Vadar_023109 [Vaccinium darrowii]